MQVFSFFFDDQRARSIEIEYHARFQIPNFQILGLPAPEIQEARERIMAAFQSAEIDFPKKKIIVNLSPSHIRKSGTGHDLAIAIKIYSEVETLNWAERVLAWGELGLDGKIKSAGRMAMLIELLVSVPASPPIDLVILSREDFLNLSKLLAWRKHSKMVTPPAVRVWVADHLSDLKANVQADLLPDVECSQSERPISDLSLLPLAGATERLISIAMVGNHHVLLLGPKGIGKSESIRWFNCLRGPSPSQQTWERILADESRGIPFTTAAPVRQVHAQVRPAHLLGSFHQNQYQAGELALAHGGQFVADEFVEWPRDSKECLREPLQEKKVNLVRARGRITANCDFQLIATGNLCPCGGLPPRFRSLSTGKKFSCRCKPSDAEKYLAKLSGPILDRIDLTCVLSEAASPGSVTEISALAQRVNEGRTFSLGRFGDYASKLSPQWLEENLPKPARFQNLLSDLPSLRARHKVLRVARSIQALEGSSELSELHVFEAKQYRMPEPSLLS